MRTSAPSRTGSSVRQRSRARRPATLKLTGSVNTCRPHTAQHRAKDKTRTRDHANLACPIQEIEFPLLGGARSLRPPAALDDAQINPICFARALDRRDRRDVPNGGYLLAGANQRLLRIVTRFQARR